MAWRRVPPVPYACQIACSLVCGRDHQADANDHDRQADVQAEVRLVIDRSRVVVAVAPGPNMPHHLEHVDGRTWKYQAERQLVPAMALRPREVGRLAGGSP
jgi:hypothetical protein